MPHFIRVFSLLLFWNPEEPILLDTKTTSSFIVNAVVSFAHFSSHTISVHCSLKVAWHLNWIGTQSIALDYRSMAANHSIHTNSMLIAEYEILTIFFLRFHHKHSFQRRLWYFVDIRRMFLFTTLYYFVACCLELNQVEFQTHSTNFAGNALGWTPALIQIYILTTLSK